MKDYFLFLKTSAGKGYLNLFLSSTFLVGNGLPLVGYILCGLFFLCGVFFIIVGHCTVSIYDNADFNSREIAGNAAKGAANMANENSHLL